MKTAESWLEAVLQYRFRNTELLQQALTHRSARRLNNERLEFLGDAVLDFVISEVLYRARPDVAEGDLSKLRASLVKDETLAEIARELDVGEYLILGSGEMKSGGYRRESILADALEAIFGAVFLDAGFDAARTIIETAYTQRIKSLPNADELLDSKTRLQEWLQARKMSLPAYDLVSVSGKDHRQRFTVSCTVVEKSVTTSGESTTRRKAEQVAAQAMFALISAE